VNSQRGLDTVSEFGSRKPNILASAVWRLATHRLIRQQSRKAIRKRLASSFPGPFDVEAEGVRMRAYPYENYCDRTIVGRGVLPEIPERRLLGPFLHPGMVFVDIGANVGTYSLFVARCCGDNARILAFEPHPRTFTKLAYNVKINQFGSIETINQGTGPKRGRLDLFTSGGTNIGTASLHEGAINARERVAIKITTLSEALSVRHIRKVDLIKVDVEGYEDQALLPLMQEQFRHLWPKAVLLEMVLRQHWKTDCIGHLRSLGYREIGSTSENSLLELSTDHRET
jgi:FkbM family methyltransferase